MKNENIYNNKMKEVFNRIGYEKAPPDFTAGIMSLIQLEQGITVIKAKPVIPYYLSAIFTAIIFLTIPFGNYIVSFTNDLLFKVSNIDFGFINRFFNTLPEMIEGYSLSSTSLIILCLSMIFFCITIITAFPGYLFRTQRIIIS